MNAIETWVTDLAKELLKDDEEAERTIPGRTEPTTIEQRVAVGLLQARATELRELAPQVAKLFNGHVLCQQIASEMVKRALLHEKKAMELCVVYPPGSGRSGKITITQHIPAFVDTRGEDGEEAPRKTAEVDSLDSLRSVDWVRSWEYGESTEGPFFRWSQAPGNGGRADLMIERDRGRWFWVVAHMSAEVDWLPKWEAPKRLVHLN